MSKHLVKSFDTVSCLNVLSGKDWNGRQKKSEYELTKRAVS